MWARNLLFVAVVVRRHLRASRESVPARHRIAEGRSSTPARRPTTSSGRSSDRWTSRSARSGQRRGLTPAPRADDLAVARRLSLALTGSVPSLEEIRQFEAAARRTRGWTAGPTTCSTTAGSPTTSPTASPGPTSAPRTARSSSTASGGIIAWLSDELLKNTSYAEIVRQMIAAQGLNTDKPAVNFIAASYDENKERPDPEKLAIRVSRAFLGLRIDCAQCHDHFLEPSVEADALPVARGVLRPDAARRHEHPDRRRRASTSSRTACTAARTRSPRPCRSSRSCCRTTARGASGSRRG